MRGFLLDSHVPRALGPALRSLRECEIVHLAHWRSGLLLDSRDKEILRAVAEEDLVVVSHDINTMPHVVARMIASGAPLVGVALFSSHVLAADIGALARALDDLLDHPERLDPAYPVVYLRHGR